MKKFKEFIIESKRDKLFTFTSKKKRKAKKFKNEEVKEKDLKATGDCYVDAVRFIQNEDPLMNNDDDYEYLLVHGLAVGRGPIEGVVFNHAWVETRNGQTAIDPSTNPRDPVTMPTLVYYALGNIDKKSVYRYTPMQARKKMASSGTYGPWETKLLKNKY